MMEAVFRLAMTINYFLLIAAFCPGAAMLHFAKKADWSFVPTAMAVVLLLMPAAVIANSPALLAPTPKEIHHGLAYALWFFPGLIVLLHKWNREQPRLRTATAILYLLPYFLASFFLYLFSAHSLANPAVSCIVAMLVILFFHSDRLLVAARIVGVLLLLVPIAGPLALRLPEHRAMAKACRSEAGMAIDVTPSPTNVIALDLGKDGCGQLCRELLMTRSVAAVETAWEGKDTGGRSHAAGLYRFEFGPFISPRAEPHAQGDGDAFCYRKISWGGVPDCIVATSIARHSARYLIALGEGEPKPEGIRVASFDIVDQDTREVVAWTKAYWMRETHLTILQDIPLAPQVDMRRRCPENGPPIKALLNEFMKSSRR